MQRCVELQLQQRAAEQVLGQTGAGDVTVTLVFGEKKIYMHWLLPESVLTARPQILY